MWKTRDDRLYVPSPEEQLCGLWLNWMGSGVTADDYLCAPRVLPDYQLVVLSQGRGTLESNSEHFRLTAPVCFFLFPGIRHAYWPQEGNHWQVYWLGFDGPRAQSMISELGVAVGCPILALQDEPILHAMYNRLWKAINSPETTSPSTVTAWLYTLFSQLTMEHSPSRTGYIATHAIEAAVALLETNYARRISIDELPAYVGLPRTRFFSQFRTRQGCSPADYLIQIRLQRAKWLLLNTALSVEDIARSVGYEDPYYFSRLFRKRNNLNPTAFRCGKLAAVCTGTVDDVST